MQGEWIRKPASDTSVVFVHGILSSGDACWKHANGAYWPDLLKNENTLSTLGIYVFTYRSDIFSGNYRLGDAVDALKEHLQLDGLLDGRRIVFVCHSMGGIVVRQFLVSREANLIERNIAVGLFLLASPSLGSAYANWLSRFAEILGNTQAQALRFAQNNAWLNDLDRNFLNLKEAERLKIVGKELIEDNFIVFKKLWRKQVVEPFSGARYFGEPFKIPHSDHSSIAKPENKQAVQHRLLHRFIAEILVQEPTKNATGPSAAAVPGVQKPDTSSLQTAPPSSTPFTQSATTDSGQVIQAGRDVIIQPSSGASDKKDIGKRIALWLGIVATAITIVTSVITHWPEASPKSSRFYGVVKDQRGSGVPGAEIEVHAGSSGELIGADKSQSSGEFSFPIKEKWEETVFVRVSLGDSIGFEGNMLLQGNQTISFAPFKRR